MKITLATLPQASAQEVFDQVATHLLTQDRQSKNGALCAYRSNDGLMCAAGCLIGDSEYATELDNSGNGNTWGLLVGRGWVPSEHAALIRQLQSVHDCYIPVAWKAELLLVADAHNLSPAVVTNFKVQQ
jgi:hypothetical protein